MSLKNKINILVAACGYTSTDLGEKLGVSRQMASEKLRGITKIRELLKICKVCGFKMTLTDQRGNTIPVCYEDIEEDDKRHA